MILFKTYTNNFSVYKYFNFKSRLKMKKFTTFFHFTDSRIVDIKGWVDKLNWKRKDVQNETDFVIEHRGRLQRALEATVEPLQITQACLAFRLNLIF